MTDPAAIIARALRKDRICALHACPPGAADCACDADARAVLAALAAAGMAPPVWRPIASAPVGDLVLLYCPDIGVANRERIELGYADNGNGSHHAWATAWQPLPAAPAAPAVDGDREAG